MNWRTAVFAPRRDCSAYSKLIQLHGGKLGEVKRVLSHQALDHRGIHHHQRAAPPPATTLGDGVSLLTSARAWFVALRLHLGGRRKVRRVATQKRRCSSSTDQSPTFTPLGVSLTSASVNIGRSTRWLLVAQAQAEGLVLVTRDARIPRYGIRTLTA